MDVKLKGCVDFQMTLIWSRQIWQYYINVLDTQKNALQKCVTTLAKVEIW